MSLIRKLKPFAVFCIILTTIVITSIVSYYILAQISFTNKDRVFYGKSQAKMAAEIRRELMKHKNISSVVFSSDDGIGLSGLLARGNNPIGNMVICHGYKGSKEFLLGFIRMFPEFNKLFFDFRSHGQSEGSIISLGCHEYKDVVSAIKYLDQETNSADKKLPMIVLGTSMGGAACLKAVDMEQNLCDAVIVDSTFADLYATFVRSFYLNAGLPYYPFFPVIKTMFNYFGHCDISTISSIQSVKRITQPIFFIHSCDDKVIKPQNSLQLYMNAQNKKSQLWIGPLCHHGWLHNYYPRMYRKKIIKFLVKSNIIERPANVPSTSH